MTDVRNRRHRPDRGNGSLRLDPYGIDDAAITLEEWRRWEMPTRPPTTRPTATRRTPTHRRTEH